MPVSARNAFFVDTVVVKQVTDDALEHNQGRTRINPKAVSPQESEVEGEVSSAESEDEGEGSKASERTDYDPSITFSTVNKSNSSSQENDPELKEIDPDQANLIQNLKQRLSDN